MKSRNLALLLPILLAGCSSPSVPDIGSGAADLIDVELQLNWYPEAEHGGYFAALAHGYYEQEGLRVTIKPGGPSVPVLAQVASGRAMFGVSNAHQILLGHAQEAKTVAVMAPLQDSPRCIMVHEESGIRSFDDLRDMTLAVNSSSTFFLYLQEKAALPDVRLVPYTGNVTQFLLDENYAQQAYVFSEPFVAQKQGAKPHMLMVSDLGFNPYTSVLITHPDRIARQPDVVQRMVTASVRGWKKYLDDPEPTNRWIHERNPDMDVDILAFGAEILWPLCVTDEVAIEELGQMNPKRWQILADQLLEVEAMQSNQVDWRSAFNAGFVGAE